ncbi:MAG: HEAT repeat domain-containing protein [Anaerolineae bacterium]|nr:HEAT repeat domain-containing protein [Anaerolineae bacterium]
MVFPLITATLVEAGIRLLNMLIDRSLDYGEATDSAVYIILEHWLQDVVDPDALRMAIDRAQDEFSKYAEAHEKWLELFAELLKYAGLERLSFAENLWRAYLFQSQEAADVLWDQYPEIQNIVTIETGRYLPRSWSEWILPMQTFLSIVVQCLIEENATFQDIFTSDDLLNMVEDMAAEDARPVYPHEPVVPIPIDRRFDSATLLAYLNACAEQIGQVDARGYTRSVHTTVPFSDVYIPLRLVALSDYDQPAHYIRYQVAGYDDPEFHIFHDPLGCRELEAHEGELVSEVLAKQDRLLILGESGAGKTTLLRHLVLEYARLLLEEEPSEWGQDDFKLPRPCPIYLDLADYIENRNDEETIESYLLRSAAELSQHEEVASLLLTLLERGQCLILLDGLDQAATDEQRRTLVANIAQAASDWHGNGNRIAVSSRLQGYGASPLPREFVGYLIRPLDRSQVGAFLLRWKLTLDIRQRPTMDRDRALRRAQPDMLALSRQIVTNPRLSGLANTPLLLRMLVGVFKPGMVISPQRVAIYHQVAEALIREWRLPQVPDQQPAVLEHEVIPLLGELAYWLQSSRPTGILTEMELRDILGRIWSRLHDDLMPMEVDRAIGSFLGILRVRSGVFIELGPERYGFIYQGLQEYFAARYLVASYRRAAKRIRENLHDPRWDEVIMLAIGFVSMNSPDDASELVETAVMAHGEQAGQFGHASSPFEALLKRDLFFAARLLGSGVEIRPDIVKYVIEKLTELWIYGERDSLGRFSAIYDMARRHLINLEGTSATWLAAQSVFENLSAPSEYSQAFAVDSLTFWPSHLDEAQKAVVALGYQQPLLVRRALANALSRMGALSKEAYVYLLMLTADTDEKVATSSKEALAHIPPVPTETLNMWIEFLHSDDPVRRRVSLRRLKQIGSLPRTVINELLQLLNDPEPTICQRAVETLAGISNLPDDALTVICRTIADGDPSFRSMAISAFARPIELPSLVVSQLVLWSDDPDGRVRTAAIRALGACTNNTSDIVDALIERLDDPSDSIRAAVIDPIVRKGKDDPQALHMLSHIATDTIPLVRGAVASALKHIPEPNTELREVLYILLSDREVSVREATLDTIASLRDPGPEIVDYLNSLVVMPDHTVTRGAVRALASLRNLPDVALISLIQSLQTYGDTLGQDIVNCLKAHTPLSSEVVNYVMDLAVMKDVGSGQLKASSAKVRVLALEILGHALEDAPAIQRILLDAAHQAENVEVRAAALRSMANVRELSATMVDTLRNALRSGPLDVRCAAGIALGFIVRHIPDPPLTGKELLEVARDLSDVLSRLPLRAAWDEDSRKQNEIHRALGWIVARARPTVPRLGARSEDTSRYLDQ